jgi:hypothetical protein
MSKKIKNIKENMGRVLSQDHYLELLQNLKDENQINDPDEMIDFIDAMNIFIEQLTDEIL